MTEESYWLNVDSWTEVKYQTFTFKLNPSYSLDGYDPSSGWDAYFWREVDLQHEYL